MDNQKLMDLLQNNAFMEKILSAASTEEVKSLFSEQGLNLTDENINALGQALEKAIANGGELSEDDLADVSGGGDVSTTAIVTALSTVGLGSAIIGGYLTHKAEGWWRSFKHGIAADERKKYEEIYGKNSTPDAKKKL